MNHVLLLGGSMVNGKLPRTVQTHGYNSQVPGRSVQRHNSRTMPYARTKCFSPDLLFDKLKLPFQI